MPPRRDEHTVSQISAKLERCMQNLRNIESNLSLGRLDSASSEALAAYAFLKELGTAVCDTAEEEEEKEERRRRRESF
jgi:hypothetical protein